MKKLLFLINSLSGGGAEKVLVDMVNALDKQKYDITVQTLINDGVYVNTLNENIHYKSIIKTKNKGLRKLLSYLIQFVIPPSIVYKLFIRGDYDVETAYLEGAPLKLIAASDSHARKLTWVHIDLYNYDHNTKLFKSTAHNAECYKRFDKIICVSGEVEKMFLKKFGEFRNTQVQYNVLDEVEILKKSEEECELSPSNGLRFVSVGRLAHQKGYDRLIDIFASLKSEGMTPELIILGQGPDRGELEKQIKSAGLDNVKLMGFQKNPYKYIARSDVFICSSRAEGFSTVATEAILLGKPIVTTDCAGMHDLLGDSEYGLITENDENALYEGIKAIIKDKNLLEHYREQATKRREYFKKETRIKEIERLFDEK